LDSDGATAPAPPAAAAAEVRETTASLLTGNDDGQQYSAVAREQGKPR
jgi:hypothetical protein